MSKDSPLRVPGLPGPAFTLPLLAMGLLVALAPPPASAAAWRPAGLAFDSTATGQSSLRMVTDRRGGFIAAWIDTLSGNPNIRCQRVDSTGAIRWTPGGVLARVNAEGVTALAAAPDSTGGILLAWVDSAGVAQRRVLAQRVDGSGGVAWGAGVTLNATAADTLQHSPAVTPDGTGGAVVSWVENRAQSDDDVYVQRLRPDGAPAWNTGGVGVDNMDTDNQAGPRVLGDGRGGAWIAWDDLGSSATQTHFQRYDLLGVAQWASPAVPTTARSESAFMTRVPSTDTLIVAWTASVSGSERIRGTFLLPDGTFSDANGSNLRTTTSLPIGLVAESNRAGIVVYANATQLEATGITTGGVGTGTSVTLATTALDATSGIDAVPDGENGAYVVWASGGSAYAQRLTPAAALAWAAPVALTTGVPAAQTHPAAALGPDLLAGWVDGRAAATTHADLFAQRVSPSGVTGSTLRIYSTVAAGTGSFSQGGGRIWVAEGESLQVKCAGSGSQRIDHLVVNGVDQGIVPNYTFHNVAADGTLQAHFSSTPATLQVAVSGSAYRDFSLPFDLNPSQPDSVFRNLMPYDVTRWKFGHWNASDSAYAEPGHGLTAVAAGEGYWFRGTKDTVLAFSGLPVSDAQFPITMLGKTGGKGWTQFGQPFRFPLAVSQLRLSPIPNVPITDPANVYTDSQVLEWNGAGYDPVSVLLPGHAYWLHRNSASAVTLRFPFESYPVSGSLEPALAAADWSIGVGVRSGSRRAALDLGVAAVAEGRWNRLSTHAPPAGPGGGISLVARVTDWGEDNGGYRAVFRPDATALAWEFDASVPEGLSDATLSFAFDRVPAGRRVTLSEPAAGWSRELAAGASLPLVLSGNVRRLRLEVTAGAAVTPRTPETALRSLGPNPFRDATTLSFALGEAGPLRWEVFDLAGRRVASATRVLTAGEHTATWDGRDESGGRVRPGIYLLRWQAGGRSGSARLVRMP